MSERGEHTPLLQHATETRGPHTRDTWRAQEKVDSSYGRRSRGWPRRPYSVVFFVGLVLLVAAGIVKSTSKTTSAHDVQLQRYQQLHQQHEQVTIVGSDQRSSRSQAESSAAGTDGHVVTRPVSSTGEARDPKREPLERQLPLEDNAAGPPLGGITRGKRDGGWTSGSNGEPGVTGEMESDGGRGSGETQTTTAKKPNVFFFLVDDLGYGDIGYQSLDLAAMTPNLDALAGGGIKLKNYYTMAICTPARASLMTGRYAIRYGMQYSVIVAGAPWGLPINEKILPQYMNEAGYESHMVGKWHLGNHNESSLPNRRGFKTYMGYLNGEDTYYTHKNTEAFLDNKGFYDFGFGNETAYYDITKTKEGIPCSGPGTDGGQEELFSKECADTCFVGVYCTDAYLGRARQIIESKDPEDGEPLFMYIAHQSVHAPTGPAPTDDFTREEENLLEMVGIRTESDQRSRFAAVLMYLDKRLGEFMDFLEENGWLDNAIIAFASDNGGCPLDGGSNYPLRGGKNSMFEGGGKVPAFIWSKSHIPQDLWGTTYDNVMHVTDWLPTLTSAVGGNTHGSAGDLDGVDHWSSLTKAGLEGDSGEAPRTEMLYNWNPYLLSSLHGLTEDLDLPQGAFREGNWKLLVNVWCSGYYSFDPTVIQDDPLLHPDITCQNTCQCQECADSCQTDTKYHFADRLYNLESDPREEHDLIHIYPEIAARLRSRAEEVVFSDWTSSKYVEVNEDSYQIWKANDWWMLPWLDKLPPAEAP